MIRRITIRHFKRFREEVLDLGSSIVLAGPNNTGKSTLLQAVATWKFALDRWMSQRSGSKAVRRTGVPITRSEFSAVPLREMNLLWEGRRVGPKKADPDDRGFIEIIAEGRSVEADWTCGLEFQYANPEMVYVRPMGAKSLGTADLKAFPPKAARNFDVLYVPALSGIEREEPRRERGMQDSLVGQGRPGEILRNLLWEVAQQDGPNWSQLTSDVKALFGIELLEPAYSPSDPYILCDYRESKAGRTLDLSSAGSGTLQVLLVFAFLYARPASMILLDEPDAHQHAALQIQTYQRIVEIARQRHAQVLIATHSETILNATDPSHVMGFAGGSPRLVATRTNRDRLREALKRITTTELLRGREAGVVLYTEGKGDQMILAAWARVLGHRASRFFRQPFVVWLHGRSLGEAKSHYFALQAVIPNLRAVFLLDGDNREEPDVETNDPGLLVLRWRRYEIENYLLQPDVLKRSINFPLLDHEIDDAFGRHVPPGTDLFGDHVALVRIKASSEFLVPLLRDLNTDIAKQDLHSIASAMKESEIHPEVKEKLNKMAEILVADEGQG